MLGESRKMSYLCSRNSDSPSHDLKTATSAGCKAAKESTPKGNMFLYSGGRSGKRSLTAG